MDSSKRLWARFKKIFTGIKHKIKNEEVAVEQEIKTTSDAEVACSEGSFMTRGKIYLLLLLITKLFIIIYYLLTYSTFV